MPFLEQSINRLVLFFLMENSGTRIDRYSLKITWNAVQNLQNLILSTINSAITA